jgi:hypothetical protein
MVPVMEGWIEQRQANVPAVEKVWLNVAPGLAYVVIRGSRVEATLLAYRVGVHADESEPRV